MNKEDDVEAFKNHIDLAIDAAERDNWQAVSKYLIDAIKLVQTKLL